MPGPTHGEAGPLLAWPQALPPSSSTPWMVPRAVPHLWLLPPDVARLFWGETPFRINALREGKARIAGFGPQLG